MVGNDYVLEIRPNENRSLVEFTVRGQRSVFLKYVRIPLAFILSACAIPQLLAECRSYKGFSPLDTARCILGRAMEDSPLVVLNDLRRPLTLLAIGIAVTLLFSLQQPSDSLLVMEDLGVQIMSTSRWKFWNQGREFIPLSDIIDIVVHEGFHGYGQVIFYMCVLTRVKGNSSDGNGVKLVFPDFLPRKDILLQVWKQSRLMLYGDTRRHFRRVPGQGLRELKHLH